LSGNLELIYPGNFCPRTAPAKRWNKGQAFAFMWVAPCGAALTAHSSQLGV